MKPPPLKVRPADLPAGHEIDYMVYQLAEGDMTRADWIWQNKSYEDCVLWSALRGYDSYATALQFPKE